MDVFTSTHERLQCFHHGPVNIWSFVKAFLIDILFFAGTDPHKPDLDQLATYWQETSRQVLWNVSEIVNI